MAKVARAPFRIARATRGRAMRKARGRIRGKRRELAVYGFQSPSLKNIAISGKCLTDAPCRAIILSLAFIGGLGFPVLDNLVAIVSSKMHSKPYRMRHRRELRVRLSLHARLAITASLVLVVLGWVAFSAFEWHGILGGMPAPHKVAEGLALAVNPRSSGFAFSEVSQLSPPSQVATMALMFIGGSAR